MDKKFTKCPHCGSEDRLFGRMENTLKLDGKVNKEFKACYQKHDGVLRDPQVPILLGAKVPSFAVATDVCLDCGAVYAIEVHIGEAEAKVQNKPIVPKTDIKRLLSSNQGRN